MPEKPAGATSEALARRLDEAWEGRRPISPLSESAGLETPEQAYEVQQSWTRLRAEKGDRVVGRKIGLTSPAMQQQFGVDEPDYGSLWASRFFPAQNGRVEIPAGPFLQPRLEGEIAFLIKARVSGPGVTPDRVLAATEAVAMAVEVVDSRIEDWRIRLADTIADNASYGGFTTGAWSRALVDSDLRALGMLIHKNGLAATEGVGAAALGDPAHAVAWLANKISYFGVNLEPGDVVLSGSLGKAVPAQQGDAFTIELHGQPPLAVNFT